MRGFAGAIAIAAVLALGANPAAAAEPSGDEAASMYQPTTVTEIRLTLSPTEKAALEADPDEYVKGTFSIAETDGTPAGVGTPSAPVPVEIRLKGQLGSARTLDQKAAFKLKFKKTEKFRGLQKMTLNNMVQDTSMIHEVLAYRAFAAARVPSPRTGYAYVYLNDEDFGLHLNLETLDKIALEKRFGSFQEPPQHLYEGAYGNDVGTGGAGAFEIDEGKDERLDLEALIERVNASSPADFSDRVQEHADLVEMTRMWAVELYLGHWDGYVSKNNYYLLSDAAGRFQMLPWGTDQTWSSDLDFASGYGVLFQQCMADTSCAALYRKALRQAQVAIADLQLEQLASDLAARLLPWQEVEEGNDRREHIPSEIEAAVQGTLAFIESRPDQLADWLQGQPAEVSAKRVTVALAPMSLPANGSATTTATATVIDADDQPDPGEQLAFASSAGSAIGPVVDLGDGTYTAQVTASTVAGANLITASVAGIGPAAGVAGAAVLTQLAGPATRMALTLAPNTTLADGASTATATASIADANGNPIPGHAVAFSSTDAGQRIGAVTDHGDGTYTVPLTASTTAGIATITATDSSVDPALTATATLLQGALPARPGLTPVPAGGAASMPTATITAAPPRHGLGRRPSFRFVSDRPGASFECKLDARAYRECESPHRLGKLAPGSHTFRVTAVDPAGVAGPAAVYRFTVEPHRAPPRRSTTR
jgi:hypothetical protein